MALLRKKTFLLIFLLFNFYFSFSQEFQDDYGTSENDENVLKSLIWYGNNQFLYDYLEDLEKDKNFQLVKGKKIRYRVPIKFWFYHTKKVNPDEKIHIIKKLIQEINFLHLQNETGFLFYVSDVKYMKKKSYVNLNYFTEYTELTLRYRDKSVINVHLVNSIKKINKYVKGSYNKVTKGVVLVQKPPISTLTHEIGHYFGLFHPHKNWEKGKCRQEAVNRKQKFPFYCLKSGFICEKSGDGLCDTPAEPLLSDYMNNKSEFKAKNLKDNWGDIYKPNLNNIMSYVMPRDCRNKFTTEQIAVMLYTAEQNKNSKNWRVDAKNNRFNFDNFEPDNRFATANKLKFSTKETHSLHQVIKNGKTKDEDKDFFKILLKKKKNNLIIHLYKAKYKCENIKLSVYNASKKEIFSKNINNLKKEDKTKINNLALGTYFIKVEKIKANNKLLDYTIMAYGL